MTGLDGIRAMQRAQEKLKEAVAMGLGATLTARETKELLDHLEWLGNQRESLLRSLPDDD